MKRFNEYLNEDFDPAIYNHDGSISIDDPTVVESINSNLDLATAVTFRTPYNALEEVRKVLAYYKIFLPKSIFLDKTDGNDAFEISQFGEKMGMNNQGEVVTAPPSSLFVYFEWSMNEDGMYDVFASVVDDEELQEIMDDFDSETEESVNEEMSMAQKSFLMYKMKNQEDEPKKKSDVDNTEEMCESAMPDLKKKIGAKKASLANRMAKTQSDNDKTYKDWRKDMPDKETTHKLVGEANEPFEPPFVQKGKEKSNPDRRAATLSAKALKKVKKSIKKKKIDEASITVASKKAEKGTKWKVKSKNHDSEGSDIELRQGKRVKAVGGYDRNSQDFGLIKTKKGKMDMKDRGAYYDSAKDILKTVKEENIQELSKGTLGSYVTKASHDVATKSAAVGRYADRANRARDEMKKGDYKNWSQGKKDDEFADKMFKKSWKRRQGIAKAVDKLTREETINEISAKLASSYLKGNHKSVTDKKGIKLWKAYKRADGRELAVDKLSGKAKVNTVNEVSHALAKRAEHKAAGKYYQAYDDEKDARKKLIRDKTPEARKGAEDAKETRTKAANRVIRFQKYADKKK